MVLKSNNLIIGIQIMNLITFKSVGNLVVTAVIVVVVQKSS